MRQSCFQRLAVLRMRCRFQFVHDTNARQLQVLFFLLSADLRVGFVPGIGVRLSDFCGFYLSFDILAFPSSRHTPILA